MFIMLRDTKIVEYLKLGIFVPADCRWNERNPYRHSGV